MRRETCIPILSFAILIIAALALTGIPWMSTRVCRAEDGVFRATLPNGLRVIIVRNTLSPAATTVINYQVGSNEAPQGFPGTAHALEHMMFRGSPGLSADQLAAITAGLGGSFNADTQQTVTQYFFTVPAENLDLALHIESLRMRGVLSTDSLWAQERGAIEQEVVQDLSNPEYVFYTRLLSELFKGTVYENDALGSRESFDKTTGAMLRGFHDTWYVPNNAVLVIAGNVDPKQTMDRITALFGDIPSGKLPARPEIRLRDAAADSLTMKTDLPYGMAVISFRMPGSDSPDYAAAQILSDVLSSPRGSLYSLVTGGMALDAGFEYSEFPETGLGFGAAIFPPGADGNTLVKEIRGILSDVIKNGVPAELVDAAKRQEVSQAEFEKNSVSGLAMAWSQAVAVEGRQSPQDDIDAIQKVTVEDVNRAARTYLAFDHAITAVLNPEASGKPISSQAFGGAESFTPGEVKPVTLPDWAAASLQKLIIPASSVNPTVTMLPNGIQLIVQPETISNTVTVVGRIRNNPYLETPAGKEGVDRLLGLLFPWGTTTLDRTAFQKALDDIGARETAGTDFTLQVLADYFDRGVQLLADNVLHPALPEQAFGINRQELAAAVKGERDSPDYQARMTLRSALAPRGDPTLREPTETGIAALTLQDVQQYHQRVFRPDLTTIVVIGKVTPDQARKTIGAAFGSWKSSGPKPDVLLPPVPPNRPAVFNVPDASRIQDKVTLSETLELNRSNPDFYALQLGNHVLGGAFYATRLYRDLRENAGLVYFVSSDFEFGKTRSFYTVEYACDPPNVSRARTIVRQNLMQMRETPVTPEELQHAKALLLREIPISESSVDDIASGLLSRADLDLPLDEPLRAARRYMALDAVQVRDAFARWIRPDDLVQVTEGPAPK